MKIHYFLFTLFCLSSCGKLSSPANAIPRDQLINIYADMMILREESSLSNADSSAAKRSMDSLYNTYHTSAEEVDASLQYYKSDLLRWKAFFEDVAKRLEFIQQKQRSGSQK